MTWEMVGFLGAGGGLTLLGTIIGSFLTEWLGRGTARRRWQDELELDAIDDTRRQLLDAADFLGAFAVGDGKRMGQVNAGISTTDYKRADMLLLGDAQLLDRMAQEFARVTAAGFGGSRAPRQLSEWGRLTSDLRQALREQERRVVRGRNLIEIDTDDPSVLQIGLRMRAAWDRMSEETMNGDPEQEPDTT